MNNGKNEKHTHIVLTYSKFRFGTTTNQPINQSINLQEKNGKYSVVSDL